MADRSLRFDLIAKDKSFSKTLDQAGRKGQRLNRELTRTIGGAGDQAGRRFSVGLSKRLGGGFAAASRMAVRSIGAIGVALGAVQAIGWLKGAIDDAREAAKVGRQTAAVIKATGGVANVTAKDVDRLSASLMAKVAVDDDIIATGANMILTFKGVRNEAGKNNDIFDQATTAAVDMTAALNKGEVTQEGLQSSSIRLGRALNDPIKGVAALTRAGVTFTQKQKDQIKALVEAGDTMGAQKIILGELKSEFGGAAKAAADPWQRVQTALGEVKEQIGTALLPAFEDVADWLSVKVPAAVTVVKDSLRTARDWWTKNKDAVKVLSDVLSGMFVTSAGDATKANDDLRTSAEKLRDMLDDVLEWTLRAVQGYDWLGAAAQITSIAFLNLVKVGGKVINVVDRLMGGTGHAGDAFVNWADEGLTKAHRLLDQVRQSAKDAQTQIDKLHGKNVNITGTTSLHFTKSFSQSDWLAARQVNERMAAKGMLVQGPGGPTADQVPIWASAGEAVVPARLVPAVAPFLGANGVPGFASGGLVGKIAQTGQAQSGVGKMMDRWGTIWLSALVKKAMAGGPGIQGALSWARTQVGKPYIWGGVGPGGYDCSGFMSALTNVVMGHNPYRRLFATGSFPVGGWAPGYTPAGFSIGSRRGNPGHMAGTLGGVNVESSGSIGVHMGAGARGARDSLFGGNIWHLVGRSGSAGGAETVHIGGRQAFDQGGMLQPGATLAVNNTGRPEAVGFDYDRMAAAFVRALEERPPAVYLDRQKVSRAVRDGQLWEARR